MLQKNACLRALVPPLRNTCLAIVASLLGATAIASTASVGSFSISTIDTNLFDGIDASAALSFEQGRASVFEVYINGYVFVDDKQHPDESGSAGGFYGGARWGAPDEVSVSAYPEFAFPDRTAQYILADAITWYTIDLTPHTLVNISAHAEVFVRENGFASAGLALGGTSDVINSGSRNLGVTYASGDTSERLLFQVTTSASYEKSPIATPVPEPSSYALMLVGLLGLGFHLRKKHLI